MPAWTISSPNLRKLGPVVEIRIGMTSAEEAAAHVLGDPVPVPLTVAALIDTGASHTVLRKDLATQLGLQPLGPFPFLTASSPSAHYTQYAARLYFPHNVEKEVLAVEMSLQGQHVQCLIGRDILADAVLVYLGESNLFSLSF